MHSIWKVREESCDLFQGCHFNVLERKKSDRLAALHLSESKGSFFLISGVTQACLNVLGNAPKPVQH